MDYRTKTSVLEGLKGGTCRDGEFHGFYDYQPGNGTRYLLSISRVPAELEKTFGVVGGGYSVAYIHHRAVVIPAYPNYFLHWSDVSTWFRCNKADAVVLAEVIGYIIGVPATTTEQAIQEDIKDGGSSARAAVQNLRMY